ncbi:MAG: hypothetical protein ACREBE_14070 [bacterium]
MTIAATIPQVLAQRAARDAARTAERAARDAFIVPEFAVLSTAFEQLLADALGFDGRIVLTVTPVVVPVQGRTFATLNTRVVSVRSTINGIPQTVTFTPQLDFHEPDQFGLIVCSIDFPYTTRRSRQDAIARALLERGIQMRGKTVGTLLLPGENGPAQLTARDLEDAFTVWWLR